MIWIYVAAIAVCVLLSAFFAASEMSLSSCNRIRLEHMAEEEKKPAKSALKVLSSFDRALSTILIGNNLVNIAASSLGTLAVLTLWDSGHVWVATVVITLLVIVFGETIPKITAQKNATRYAQAVSYPLRFLMILFLPVTAVVVFLTDLVTKPLKGEEHEDDDLAVEELHTIIDTAEDEEILDEEESELVSAAIDFSETMAQSVMTARVDMTAIDIHDDMDEILQTVGELSYSRIPVYEDSIDNVIGILSVNHFLKALAGGEKIDLRSLLLPVTYVYKTMKLPAVLETFRESRQHLAVVTDEYGGTLGVVSMEDVMEELVGEIWDETDVVEEEIEETGQDTFEIDGDMLLTDLAEALDWPEDDVNFISDTAGGWCIEMLEDFPEGGESFAYLDAEITVLEVEERRVRKLQIRRNVYSEKTSG